MKKIFITGCNGQLGIQLKNKLKDKYDLILTDVQQLDITDEIAVKKMIQEVKPYAVINAAAYTAVDLCETQYDTAYRINVLGPKNLAEAANEADAKFVHISTDYVFDGEGIKDETGTLRPYVETDAVNPQSVYGKTKVQSEKCVTESTDMYFIIRTAWLYGQGKNFVNTMIELSKKNDTVKVVNDQIGSPTSTVELCNMIDALIQTENYGIYHGTCEGACSWYDFTKEIYRLLNIKIPVVPITTEEFPRPAKRPKYSVLENENLKKLGIYEFKTWQDAISSYLIKK